MSRNIVSNAARKQGRETEATQAEEGPFSLFLFTEAVVESAIGIFGLDWEDGAQEVKNGLENWIHDATNEVADVVR